MPLLPSTRAAPPTPIRPRRPDRASPVLGVALLLVLAGCAGAPPAEPEPPRTVAEAQRIARQAARLQAQGDPARAATAWQQAGTRFQLLNQRRLVAVAWHNEAVALRQLGNPAAAATLLERAADLNLELGETNAWWRNQIARLQLATDRPGPGAETLLAQLRRLPPPAGDPAATAALDHEEARILAAAGHLPEALTAADRARERFQRQGDRTGLAAVEMTRGRILRRQDRFADAAEAWRVALAESEALGDPRGVAVALAGLGSCLAAEGRNPGEARSLLVRARDNFTSLGMTDEARATEAELAALGPSPTP